MLGELLAELGLDGDGMDGMLELLLLCDADWQASNAALTPTNSMPRPVTSVACLIRDRNCLYVPCFMISLDDFALLELLAISPRWSLPALIAQCPKPDRSFWPLLTSFFAQNLKSL